VKILHIIFRPVLILIIAAVLISCSGKDTLTYSAIQDVSAGPIKLISGKSFISIVD
jgi:hypothetical protein